MPLCPHCDASVPFGEDRCIECGATIDEEESEAILMEEFGPDSDEPITTELGPELIAQVTDEAVLAPPVRKPTPIGEEHAALQVTVRYEYSSVPSDDPPLMGVLVGVEAFGTPLVTKEAGPVAHVILALDLSKSMDHPDKYPVLKEAVASMLDDMHAPDAADVLLSVVIFSRRSAILLRDTPARDVLADDLFQLIEESPLCFRGYTDVAGGLSHAGRIAYDQRQRDTGLPTRVYLMSDGKPQDMKQSRAIAELLDRVTVDMHSLAFGDDADVERLHQLFAGRRGGTIKRVRKDTIGFAFERVAEVSQKVVATRCIVDLELARGVVGGDAFRYRPARARFPEPAFKDGKLFRADLGTIETDRSYQLLFEIRPPEAEELVTPLGRVTVKIPGAGIAIEEVRHLSIPRQPAGSLTGDVDTTVRTARDILTALTDHDPKSALRALRLRLKIYENERRDPALLDLIRRAIGMLETEGSLEGLAPDEQATLMAHTCTT